MMQKVVRIMFDDFYMNILEFYQNPENVKALEAYRKGREVEKNGEETKANE